MQLWGIILSALSVQACSDDGDGRFDTRMAEYYHRQRLHQRAFPGSAIPPGNETLRPIVWGDLNFIHVTDTHGWLTGHPTEEDYSGDWGDFISFSKHMQAEADQRGVDLMIIETGDRHEGSGLASATDLDGELSQLVFGQAEFDVLSVGNHELYHQEFAIQEYNLLRPYYGQAYLSSNVEYFINNEWVPAGNYYRKFETKNLKKKILAFGFIFNFDKYDNGTRVVKVEEAVQRQWFIDALTKEDYDVVLVTGHTPVRGFDEFDTIVHAVRKINPNVPIQGFGGHTHVRDYRVFDSRAVALESGKYLDTIGWASMKIGNNTQGINGTDVEFTRRYIDFNPQNLARHANLSVSTFATDDGAKVSQQIRKYRKQLHLDKQLGVVSQDYLLDYSPYPSNGSLVSFTEESILPLLKGDGKYKHRPHLTVFGTNLLRYDLRKGPFIEDSKYIVEPYHSDWVCVEDVPISIASSLLDALNGVTKKRRHHIETSAIPKLPHATSTYVPAVATGSVEGKALRKGYATLDDFGSDGDDTIHEPWPVYDYPSYVSHSKNIDNSTQTVDVVFLDKNAADIKKKLSKLGVSNVDTKPYGGQSMQKMIGEYFVKQS